MPQWLVIGISGITCGGKTTLANSLREYFQNQQNMLLWNTGYIIGDVQVISQDDYFLPVDDLRHKWIDQLNVINFELITALDMKQMLSDITWTMKGRYLAVDPIENVEYMNEISMSISFDHHSPHRNNHYQQHNFSNHHNHNHHYHHQQQLQQSSNHTHFHSNSHHNQHHLHNSNHLIAAHHSAQNLSHHSHHRTSNNFQRSNAQQRGTKINILIVEGFIIFNQPELLKICQLKYHFHLPYEKCFARRKLRTYDPPDVVGYFECAVWPMYERNFSEFRERKDITMLNGETSKEQIFKFVLNGIRNYLDEPDLLLTSSTSSKILNTTRNSDNNNGACPMDHQ